MEKNISKFVGINLATPRILTFYLDDREIGKLFIQEDKMKFEGDAHISARILFDKHLKPIIDVYIKEKFEMFN